MAVKKRNVLVDVTKAGRLGGKARSANLSDGELSAAGTHAVSERWKRYYEAHPEKLAAKKVRLAKKKKTAKKKAKE